MNSDLENTVLAKFFEFYRSDIETEVVDPKNIVLSFPVHFSGFHRIEVTVTQITPDQYIISDGAKTVDELRMAGYALTGKLRKRLENISRMANLRVVNDYLVCDSNLEQLGSNMQRFLEAAKTIGDAYLVQRVNAPRDTELIKAVEDFLVSRQVPHQRKHTLEGAFEPHVIPFYFPPNGVPGLALSVIANPTKIATEAWGFKSTDIRSKHNRLQVGVIYGDEDVKDSSKAILNGVADIAIPSSNIPALQNSLQSIGILKG